MREDMMKVIVERPRPGSRRAKSAYEQARRYHLKYDDEGEVYVDDAFCNRAKTMKGYRFNGMDWPKPFNENLSPLQRFLEKSVGRKWSEVYAEVCENLHPNSTIHQHVLLHLHQWVEEHTFLKDDGRICARTSHGITYDINESYSGWDFYVHPVTGVLCKPKRVSWGYTAPSKNEYSFRKAGKGHGYVKFKDVWYAVTYTSFDVYAKKAVYSAIDKYRAETLRRADVFGVWKSFGFSQYDRSDESRYGGFYFMLSKRQLNKKEIRDAKLN